MYILIVSQIAVARQATIAGDPRHRDHFFRVLNGVVELYQKVSKISLGIEGLSDLLRLAGEGGS